MLKNCFQEKVGLESPGKGGLRLLPRSNQFASFLCLSQDFCPDHPSSWVMATWSKFTLLRVFVSVLMMMILSSGVDLGVVKCLQVS